MKYILIILRAVHLIVYLSGCLIYTLVRCVFDKNYRNLVKNESDLEDL